MSHGNWAFLFLGRDDLETTFNTESKKNKKPYERDRKKNQEEGKNANLLPFLRLMK